MIAPKLHVDQEWMRKVSIHLDRFRKIKTNVHNCRCPICGDSKQNTRKARFYFYVKSNKLNVFCQNCGYSKSFYNFMKERFAHSFEEYKRETLFDVFNKGAAINMEALKRPNRVPVLDLEEDPVEDVVDAFRFESVLAGCPSLFELPDVHPAKAYMISRAFEEGELKRLYYTPDFKSIASRVNPEAVERLKENEPRILIPFINEMGSVEMLQGRSLDPDSSMRYISIKQHDDIEKVYGLYELDRDRTSYCVEGPIDSLFVDNCIATCDGNLARSEADVLIWDNQSRNKDVLRYMENAINGGRSVVIWPFSPKKKLDINDLIKSGVTREELMEMIKRRTFSGLMAKAKFNEWRKI